MILMPKIAKNYADPRLVLRVNELFHDLEGGAYEHAHDEILVLETSRWQRIAEKFLGNLSRKARLKVLDVGSGSGFVPRVLAKFLNIGDSLVCSDISERMLKECRENLKSAKPRCEVIYRKSNGIKLPAEDGEIDLITMNSVLHHLPEPKNFFKEAGRVLKSGGYLLIGHEPNKSFYAQPVVWTFYRCLYLMYHPKAIFETLSRRGINLKKRQSQAPADPTAEAINNILFKEGLLGKPLSRPQINELVDYRSIEGFSLEEIKTELAGFSLDHFETYNHLYWIYMQHHKNPFIRALDTVLGNLYPRHGKTFFAVFKKN